MKDIINSACGKFISDRDTVKSVFKMESTYIYPVCAAVFANSGKSADPAVLERCAGLIKENTGVLSSFRGLVRLPLLSMMAVSEDPEKLLSDTLRMHELFKKHFFATEYMALASITVADNTGVDSFERIAIRTREVYDLMKKEHPFLTSGEDCVFSAMLALSGFSDERIVRETEGCYGTLKTVFHLGNAVQSLSHVLALADGFADEKCKKLFALYDALKEKGYKYGTDFELPTLGSTLLLSKPAETVAEDIITADTALSAYKGYGVFGLGKKQRLMHAAMIVCSVYGKDSAKANTVGNLAAIDGAISMVAAQQAAMLAAISAAAAANAAANS